MAILFPEDIFFTIGARTSCIHSVKNCGVTQAFVFALHITDKLLFITLFRLSIGGLSE